MPSDCQCATACETKVVTKVLNNREATKKLNALKEEVKRLKLENTKLASRLSKARISKREIISRLKKQLDKV